MQLTGAGSLSVEQWHEIAEQGADIPVRITVNGVSMLPLIRRDRDYVTVVPLKRKPVVGDIVLFTNDGARYVLHRVWAVDDGRTMTWGDNCVNPDGWIPSENVLGLAVKLERDDETIMLDTDSARREGIRNAEKTHRKIKVRKAVVKFIPRPVKKIIKSIVR